MITLQLRRQLLQDARQALRESAMLEAKLELLERFGPISLFRLKDGWCGYIELPTTVAGGEFKIRSGYQLRNCDAVVTELLSRITTTL